MLDFLKQLWDTIVPVLVATKQTLDEIIETTPYFNVIATISSIGAIICFIIKIAPKIPNWIRSLRIRV